MRRHAPERHVAKLLLLPVLLVAGCLASGLYGALHNQISYTVSPEYFHAFKFHQFDIPAQFHNRIGAAIVGWYASWWMGVFIGMPVLLFGLILPGWRTYLSCCLTAFGVIAATALLVGLAALVYASSVIPEPSPIEFWYGERLQDPAAFMRSGTMHDFSYLGGFLGIVTGSLYLLIARVRIALAARGAASRQTVERVPAAPEGIS